MSVEIWEGNLGKDRGILIKGMHAHLNPLTDERRFEWMYESNPHGPARVWIATDTESGDIVGSCGALPRLIYVHGKEWNGYVLADFWIHPRLRALGPAVRLQRACLEAITSSANSVWYDVPQRSMVAVYQRLNIPTANWLVRYTKPLQVDPWVEKLCPLPVVSTMLSAAGNSVLRAKDQWGSGKSKARLVMHDGPVGEEFSALAEGTSGAYSFCVSRSAQYLNWRFVSHFHQQHWIYSAYLGKALHAYAIFLELGHHAHIVDMFGEKSPEVWADLLSTLCLLLRKRGLHTVTLPLLESDPKAGLVTSLGFFKKEAYPIIAYAAGGALSASDAAAQNMLMMYGDQTD